MLLELKQLREQVDRLAAAGKSKKGEELAAAWFAASDRISNLEKMVSAAL